MRQILILTNPEDLHAVVVGEALKRKGAGVVLWQTSDFPYAATESVIFQGQKKALKIGTRLQEKEVLHPDFDTVWLRRPSMMWGPPQVDDEDFRFAQMQSVVFREGLLRCMAERAFWVNPPGSARRLRSKLFQHEQALQVGLELPGTAYTNDPEVIRQFIRTYGGVVYKMLSPAVWYEEGRSLGLHTIRITEEKLVADHLLRAVPGIYQELVEKDYELRVTVVGSRLFATKVRSQETEDGKLDWRRSGDRLKLEPTVLDPGIATRCLALMERLGIVFGCFDFIVTPQGEHVFLEVNQMGQFLFVERHCGTPLLDAFSELLLQGRVDFAFDERRPQLRLQDVQEAAMRQMEELKERHLTRPWKSTFPPPAAQESAGAQ